MIKKSFFNKQGAFNIMKKINKKQIVVTMAVGDSVKKMAEVTVPKIRALAKNWNADFHCFDSLDKEYGHPSCGKNMLWQFFDQEYRVCWIDVDILVKENAPNIFSIVPENHIGLVERGSYWKKGHVFHIIEEYAKNFNLKYPENSLNIEGYSGRYYNAGMFVADANTFPLDRDFVPFINLPFAFIEQTLFNIKIHEKKIPVFELPWIWNAVDGMLSLEGSLSSLLKNSYMRHYTVYKSRLFQDAKELKNV
ncbi:MAG TPA: glycosyltransferase [Bacilli bacterium]|jgi:lipopolysaccharide biosynthesis glycosyltransferase|nr:glycosyltransferase [Bacilli bacterium]